MSNNEVTAALTSILARLLGPDTEAIRVASAELKTVSKSAGELAVVESLCGLLSKVVHHLSFSGPCLKGFVFLQDAGLSPEIRQYAAVLLRKKLSKQWTKLNGNQREVIKNGILSSIVAEENGGNKAVHQALSQIAGLLFQKVLF